MKKIYDKSQKSLLLLFLAGNVLAQDQERILFRGPSSVVVPLSLNNQKNIRVRVFPHDHDYKPHGREKEKNRVRLLSTGRCTLFRGVIGSTGSTSKVIRGGSRFSFSYRSLVHPVWLSCEGETKLVRFGGVPSYTYSGHFYVRRTPGSSQQKQIEVVNVLPVETYIKGVVPAEIYVSWPRESLKTQAVAARSYALYHLSLARLYQNRAYFDLDDTVLFQAYTGTSHTDFRTNSAVQETEGEVLVYGRKVIQAFYHADSGGFTADPKEVWGRSVPFVKSMPDGRGPQNLPWDRMVSWKVLHKKLKSLKYLQGNEQIDDIFVPASGRSLSGRVRFVTITAKHSKYFNIPIRKFKKITGSLPSTLFHIRTTDRGFNLQGTGFGHGVGMSQHGAKWLAIEKKWSYQKILRHYYPQTEICRLYAFKKMVPSCKNLVPFTLPKLANEASSE